MTEVLISLDVTFRDNNEDIRLTNKKIFRKDQWLLIKKYIDDNIHKKNKYFSHYMIDYYSNRSSYVPVEVLQNIQVIEDINTIKAFKDLNYENNERSTVNKDNVIDNEGSIEIGYRNVLIYDMSKILPFANADPQLISICHTIYDGDNNQLLSYNINNEIENIKVPSDVYDANGNHIGYGIDVSIWSKTPYAGLIGYAIKNCKANRLEIIKILVGANFSLKMKNNENSTPILDIDKGSDENIEILKFLIEKGVDLNISRYGSSQNNNLLMKWYHNEEVFNILLDKNININMVSGDGKHILEYAIGSVYGEPRHGIEIVKKLVEKGANVNGSSSFIGMVPLFAAIYKGDMEIMHYLLDKGADYNIVHRSNNVLYWALTCDKLDLLEFFIKKGVTEVPKDYLNLHSKTLIEEAASRGKITAIECLIANGIDFHKTCNNSLGHALRNNHYDTFHYLLRKGLKELKDINQYEPLISIEVHKSKPRMDIVKFLIKNGSDPFAKGNYQLANRQSAIDECITQTYFFYNVKDYRLNDPIHVNILKYILRKNNIKIKKSQLKTLTIKQLKFALQQLNKIPSITVN